MDFLILSLFFLLAFLATNKNKNSSNYTHSNGDFSHNDNNSFFDSSNSDFHDCDCGWDSSCDCDGSCD